MAQNPTIILASASPRRRALLTASGLSPLIVPQDVDEALRPGESPIAYVARVARDKATAYRNKPDAVAGAIVVAADTTVALDGEVLAKAADVKEAEEMLAKLSGRTHYVHTAVCVARKDRVFERVVTTAVSFRVLNPAHIRAYVAGGEPMDKAGAYGIQGDGGALVDKVEGSYTNVVGLPLRETLELIAMAEV